MWKGIQCAIQGRGHIKTETPCQDKTFFYQEQDISIAALADGAGSARLSHYGAEHITAYICQDLAENFELYFENTNGAEVKTILDAKIKKQIQMLAEELECEPRELASTLLTVAIKEDRYIILHIGDGVIGYSKNGELKIASLPENGEFANTTVFTTSKEAVRTMTLMKGHLGMIDGFVLMSDGPEVSLYDKRNKTLAPVLEHILKMMGYIRTNVLERQLTKTFEQIIKAATTDDCSIILMQNSIHAFPGYTALNADEKLSLLKINRKSVSMNRQIRRSDEILKLLSTPQTLSALARALYLKPKYVRKKIERLMKLNLVEEESGRYQTVITM